VLPISFLANLRAAGRLNTSTINLSAHMRPCSQRLVDPPGEGRRLRSDGPEETAAVAGGGRARTRKTAGIGADSEDGTPVRALGVINRDRRERDRGLPAESVRIAPEAGRARASVPATTRTAPSLSRRNRSSGARRRVAGVAVLCSWWRKPVDRCSFQLPFTGLSGRAGLPFACSLGVLSWATCRFQHSPRLVQYLQKPAGDGWKAARDRGRGASRPPRPVRNISYPPGPVEKPC